MKKFSKLLEKLLFTPSRNAKIIAMAEYFENAPDPDRGFALGAITRDLNLNNLKPTQLRTLTKSLVDPELFDMSYDYVGDLAETISLIWPKYPSDAPEKQELPQLGEVISTFQTKSKIELQTYVTELLDSASVTERWAIIKMVTGGLRVGVSARLAKTSLAEYSGKDLTEIEKIWHGIEVPYIELFSWLDGLADRPRIAPDQIFHPLMLSNPIDAQHDFDCLNPMDYEAEWKWDGIRVQLLFNTLASSETAGKNKYKQAKARVFSRSGDDISLAFPDITETIHGHAVLDGELLIGCPIFSESMSRFGILELPEIKCSPKPFNYLQQRLNRRAANRKHLRELPAFVRVYDMLFEGKTDIRDRPLYERRNRLEIFLKSFNNPRLDFSESLSFRSWATLSRLRDQGADRYGYEGVMIKKRNSQYIPGRIKGNWFKWKRDPCILDTIMLYAQRGHGRRSSFYSDFTFGIWNDNEILPIGKAYSGFTDVELQELDKWVRSNTVNRFGPVREVQKTLVVELAFDSAHFSSRHKSGIALRFPRINRIRWDKPAKEADTLENVKAFIR
jgi:DNA ligase-1